MGIKRDIPTAETDALGRRIRVSSRTAEHPAPTSGLGPSIDAGVGTPQPPVDRCPNTREALETTTRRVVAADERLAELRSRHQHAREVGRSEEAGALAAEHNELLETHTDLLAQRDLLAARVDANVPDNAAVTRLAYVDRVHVNADRTVNGMWVIRGEGPNTKALPVVAIVDRYDPAGRVVPTLIDAHELPVARRERHQRRNPTAAGPDPMVLIDPDADGTPTTDFAQRRNADTSD